MKCGPLTLRGQTLTSHDIPIHGSSDDLRACSGVGLLGLVPTGHHKRMSNHRDRKYLDLAHRITDCMNCGQHSPGCEPAHSNQMRHGKGTSIKAHDVFHAALCHECHRALDSGGTLSRDSKQTMWQAAFERTLLAYFKNGWLRVAK